MMDSHSKFIPLLLSCTTVFTVLQGQRVVTDREVIGYQSHDVILPCHYVHETEDKLEQVEWAWRNHSSKDNFKKIIILHRENGYFLHDTFLKGRVKFRINSSVTSDASIIIKDLKMTDQGVYSCEYTTYPSGSHKGETTLKVKDVKPPVVSTAVAAGVGTVVVLSIMILASVGYLLLIKRRRAANTSAYYMTQSPGDFQQGDVTYADITILKPGKVNGNTLLTGNTEYAAVSFSGRSGTTSGQGSANQQSMFGAQTAEHGCVYAEVIKD